MLFLTLTFCEHSPYPDGRIIEASRRWAARNSAHSGRRQRPVSPKSIGFCHRLVRISKSSTCTVELCWTATTTHLFCKYITREVLLDEHLGSRSATLECRNHPHNLRSRRGPFEQEPLIRTYQDIADDVRTYIRIQAWTEATPNSPSRHKAMSGKYTFTKALKEIRFHLCQTSEHSAATRSVPISLFKKPSPLTITDHF